MRVNTRYIKSTIKGSVWLPASAVSIGPGPYKDVRWHYVEHFTPPCSRIVVSHSSHCDEELNSLSPLGCRRRVFTERKRVGVHPDREVVSQFLDCSVLYCTERERGGGGFCLNSGDSPTSPEVLATQSSPCILILQPHPIRLRRHLSKANETKKY